MNKERLDIRSWWKPAGSVESEKDIIKCSKHSKFSNIVGWVATLSVILTLTIAIVFHIMIEYSKSIGSGIEEYMVETEVRDIIDLKSHIDAESTLALKDIAANMRQEIVSTMDMDELEQDLENGIIPKELSDIFEKYLNDKTTVPRTDPETNNISVFMENGIVADFSHVYAYDSDESRTWEVEKRYQQNIPLFDNTINAILRQDTREYYAEQILRVDAPDDTYKPEYVNADIIDKIYRTYGLEGLKSYTFLVPVYIDEDGDIFGNADIVNGKHVENKKFVLVQRYSLYDFIENNNIMINKNRSIVSEDGERLEALMIISGIVILAISIVILGCLSVAINGMLNISCNGTMIIKDRRKNSPEYVTIDDNKQE